MGNFCCPFANDEVNNQINILMLGTGESGKSTIYKQTQYIFKNGLKESEEKSYTAAIILNILQTVSQVSSVLIKNEENFEKIENFVQKFLIYRNFQKKYRNLCKMIKILRIFY
jgi:guanine nucleotide-binding protein G(i) subunit alpha